MLRLARTPKTGVRALTTSDALALMNNFEAVSSRSDAHLAPENSEGEEAEALETSELSPGTDGIDIVGDDAAKSIPRDNSAWKGIEKLHFSVLKKAAQFHS